MKSKITLECMLFLFMALTSCHVQADQAKTDRAIQAAGDWLGLIDGHRYDESWEASASLFRNAVPKQQWNQSIKSAREPLGKLLKRGLKESKYMTRLPGAPDGEYMVIQYEASFENKHTATETITPMLDSDGQWRVSGYYIR